MMSGSEDKIIAYFDGELSDADSSELLHLTSISPEIRDLFREHEMLKDMAHEATRSVMVSPEVESKLFARIEGLGGASVREKGFWVFSKRNAIITVLALIAISSSAGYLVPRFFSTNSGTTIGSNTTSQSSPRPEVLSTDVGPTSIVASKKIGSDLTPTAEVNIGAESFADHQTRNRSQNSIARLHSAIVHADQEIQDVPSNSDVSSIAPGNSKQTSGSTVAMGQIHQTSGRADDIQLNITSERHSPFEHTSEIPESRSLFEAALQTSSGFTYPADNAPIKPFADQRLSIGYHVTENNLVGLRLGSGLYQQLGDVTRQEEQSVVVLSRKIETKRSFSEEIYFSHLQPIFFPAPLVLEFSIGGGLIPNGFSIGLEAGVRIPFTESVMLDVVFALSRIHSNAIAGSEISNSESTSMKPVVTDAVDIHNTLNGRLHYGLICRF